MLSPVYIVGNVVVVTVVVVTVVVDVVVLEYDGVVSLEEVVVFDIVVTLVARMGAVYIGFVGGDKDVSSVVVGIFDVVGGVIV